MFLVQTQNQSFFWGLMSDFEYISLWITLGPANYTIPTTIGEKSDYTLSTRPAYKIATKLPILTHIIHSPGPIYNPTKPHDPNAGFALSGKRKEPPPNKFPGPGSYDPFPDISQQKNKGFSMSRRQYKEKENENVGPNHYDVRVAFGKHTHLSKIKNSPSFKFNSKTRSFSDSNKQRSVIG